MQHKYFKESKTRKEVFMENGETISFTNISTVTFRVDYTDDGFQMNIYLDNGKVFHYNMVIPKWTNVKTWEYYRRLTAYGVKAYLKMSFSRQRETVQRQAIIQKVLKEMETELLFNLGDCTNYFYMSRLEKAYCLANNIDISTIEGRALITGIFRTGTSEHRKKIRSDIQRDSKIKQCLVKVYEEEALELFEIDKAMYKKILQRSGEL